MQATDPRVVAVFRKKGAFFFSRARLSEDEEARVQEEEAGKKI